MYLIFFISQYSKINIKILKDLCYKKFDDLTIIIGAQKAGTTSLYEWLKHHPSIIKSNEKELHFFNGFSWNNSLSIEELREQYYSHWNRTLSKINYNCNNRLFLEATPRYLYDPMVPLRLKKLNPRAKLIVSLREPVDRAISQLNMWIQSSSIDTNKGKGDRPKIRYDFKMIEDEMRNFSICKINETSKGCIRLFRFNSIMGRGLYAMQLRSWFKYFPREQIMIFCDSKLKYPELLLKEIEDFLDIPHYQWKKEELNREGRREYRIKITDTQRYSMKRFYEDSNKELLEMGIECEWNRNKDYNDILIQ